MLLMLLLMLLMLVLLMLMLFLSLPTVVDANCCSQPLLLLMSLFSGIPDFNYENIGQAAIMEELEKKYPDFEKRTGWRLDSSYKKEMPENLAKEVRGDFVFPCWDVAKRETAVVLWWSCRRF